MLADAVIALLMHAQSSTASIRITSKPCCRRSTTENQPPTKKTREDNTSNLVEHRLNLAFDLLRIHFEDVQSELDLNNYIGKFIVSSDLQDPDESDKMPEAICTVIIQFEDDSAMDAKISVESSDEKLASNIRDCLQSLTESAAPIQV